MGSPCVVDVLDGAALEGVCGGGGEEHGSSVLFSSGEGDGVAADEA